MITELWIVSLVVVFLVSFLTVVAATCGHRIGALVQENRYRQAELKSFEKYREIQKLRHERTKAYQAAKAAQEHRNYNKQRELQSWSYDYRSLLSETYFKDVK